MQYGQVVAIYTDENETKTQVITIPMDTIGCKKIIEHLEKYNDLYGAEEVDVKYTIWQYVPEDEVTLV